MGTQIVGQPALYVATRALVEGYITAVILVLVYQAIRQLRIVARLRRSLVRVDLFQPGPIHAMSQLTARGAILFVALAIWVDIPYPGMTEQIVLQSRS